MKELLKSSQVAEVIVKITVALFIDNGVYGVSFQAIILLVQLERCAKKVSIYESTGRQAKTQLVIGIAGR